MSEYFGLIDDIASEYSIRRGGGESALSWQSRVIYTLSGQSGYSSLWDVQDDSDSPGTVHFKRRVRRIFESFSAMYPGVRVNFPDIDAVTDEVHRVMLEGGCFWHKDRSVCAPLYRAYWGGSCVFVRGHAPGEKVSVSGLGCYRKGEKPDDTDITLPEMFGLHGLSLPRIWEKLVSNASWEKFSGGSVAEYLHLNPPFTQGYWTGGRNPGGGVSMLRVKSAEKYLHFLCEYEGGSMLVSRLPDWMDYRTAASSCLHAHGTLPPVTYHDDGGIVRLSLGYLLPRQEMRFLELFTWPAQYTDKFNRIISSDIFPDARNVLESISYSFKEE